MKKFTFIISAFIFLILSAFPFKVFAREARTSQVVSFEPKAGESRSFYMLKGETVELKGEINGDVYVVASDLIIDGKVNGDIIGAAGKIELNGSVRDNLRVAAGEIDINGTVGKNVMLAGSRISINKDSLIQGGLLAAGSDVIIKSRIEKELFVASQNAELAGYVGKDSEIWTQKLKLDSGGSLGGNLTYYSNENIEMDPSASISGTVARGSLPEIRRNEEKERGFNIFAKTIGFLGALLIGYLFIKIFSGIALALDENLRGRTLKSFLAGFASYFISPVVFIVLLVTLIGAPLALVLLFTYLFFIYFSKILIAYWLSGYLINFKNRTVGFILILALIYVLTSVGVPGKILNFAVITLGLGAVIDTARIKLFTRKVSPKKKK